MSSLDDSKLIFEQLAHVDDAAPGGGVHSVIENHDAWSNNAATLAQLSAALRQQVAHGGGAGRVEAVSRRISLQRSRLNSIALPLRSKLPAAS